MLVAMGNLQMSRGLRGGFSVVDRQESTLTGVRVGRASPRLFRSLT